MLFSEEQMRGHSRPTIAERFLVGEDASQQAAAIAQTCIAFLADPTCENIAVIFPERGALPRLVSLKLAGQGIAHNDTLAHRLPGLFETAEWKTWLELQRSPRLGTLTSFLSALKVPNDLLGKLNWANVQQALRDAYGKLLIDDLGLLRAACAESRSLEKNAAAGVIDRLFLLPEQATLAQFMAHTEEALRNLGWQQQIIELTQRAGDLPRQIATLVSRTFYLRWLEELAATSGIERSDVGDHPYAAVQLLTLADAQHREWSHVILAGANESQWPPAPSGEYAREQELSDLNQKARRLDRSAIKQGRFGEGHLTIREGHSLYLGPAEQRAVAHRQIESLLASTSREIAFAASLIKDDAPERLWNPTELFTRRYLSATGTPLNQETFVQLQRATATWLDNAATPHIEKRSTKIDQTLTAFRARREVSLGITEYEFALRPNESFPAPPLLSVSDLENMMRMPAVVWLRRYLRVSAADAEENPWALATGIWVHAWLARIATDDDTQLFSKLPAAKEIDQRICEAADEQRSTIARLCNSLGRDVPDWWTSSWLHARYIARHLASKLSAAGDWSWIATELPIGHDGAVEISPEISLQLRGQIDAVFAKTNAPTLAGQTLWIVDYKTGKDKPLKADALHDLLVKGSALQLALYSLAASALGAKSVTTSLLSMSMHALSPQLTSDDVANEISVFAELAAMQRTGVFGMRGDIRANFGARATYPLATLQVDVDLLEDKWAIAHPPLVMDKEEWEIFP
jgi:hypothetical protein